jgi:hypothetical protein
MLPTTYTETNSGRTKFKTYSLRLSTVVHACNPSCSGGRGQRIKVRSWLQQKHKTLSEKLLKKQRAWEHGSSDPEFNSQ